MFVLLTNENCSLEIYGYIIETSPLHTRTLCHKFLNQILCKIIRGVFVGKLKINHHSYCSHKMMATLMILVAYRTLVKHELRKQHCASRFLCDLWSVGTVSYHENRNSWCSILVRTQIFSLSNTHDKFLYLLFCNKRIWRWNNFSFYNSSGE